jgi:hypothetical protein
LLYGPIYLPTEPFSFSDEDCFLPEILPSGPENLKRALIFSSKGISKHKAANFRIMP